jgi:hypothetical protein
VHSVGGVVSLAVVMVRQDSKATKPRHKNTWESSSSVPGVTDMFLQPGMLSLSPARNADRFIQSEIKGIRLVCQLFVFRFLF